MQVPNANAGKSTLMGHLLVLLGKISNRQIQKYSHEAELMKKASFQYAWVLDATDDERSRGVTIDVGVSQFSTPKVEYTLLDAPGHKDFIPNMITGASQADVAMLVIDAGPGEFETGFNKGGQTREHCILCKSLGVAQMVVVVNKMDSVDWDAARFNHIVGDLKPFLLGLGYKVAEFVPASGFSGENLVVKSSPGLDWYEGPTLADVLGKLKN